MKYKLLVFFVFTLFNVNNIAAQQLLVGPKLGGGLTRPFFFKERYREVNQPKTWLGFNGGLIINYKVSNRFSWHTEALFVKKSRRVVGHENPESKFIREYQDYVEFPMLLRYSIPRGIMKINLSVGPRVGYWLGGNGVYSIPASREFGVKKIKYSIKFNNPEGSEDYYILNSNRLQLGLDVGVGVDFPIKQQRLIVDIRYAFGHTNIGSEKTTKVNEPFEDPVQYRIHQLNISFAYLFEFDLFEIRNKGKSTGD